MWQQWVHDAVPMEGATLSDRACATSGRSGPLTSLGRWGLCLGSG